MVLAHPLQVREPAPAGVHQLWLRLELREDRAPGREDLVPGLCGLGATASTRGCAALLPHTIPSGPSVVSGGRKCRSMQKLALSIKHSSVLTACSSSGLLRRDSGARIEHVPVAVTAPGVRGQRVPGELLLQVRPRGVQSRAGGTASRVASSLGLPTQGQGEEGVKGGKFVAPGAGRTAAVGCWPGRGHAGRGCWFSEPRCPAADPDLSASSGYALLVENSRTFAKRLTLPTAC